MAEQQEDQRLNSGFTPSQDGVRSFFTQTYFSLTFGQQMYSLREC